MFSEKDLVARSAEDMAHEVEELLADAKRLREDCEASSQKEVELRRESVDTRPSDAEQAEILWQEAERLQGRGQGDDAALHGKNAASGRGSAPHRYS